MSLLYFRSSSQSFLQYRSVLLCTLQVLLISDKFCDLSLLHWPLYRAVYRDVGRDGGQYGKKNLLHCALGSHVHETTYGPLIDIYGLVRCGQIHYMGKWERVGPWKSRLFWASNGTHLTARCHCTSSKKISISRAQPPPNCPRNRFAPIKSITYGAV